MTPGPVLAGRAAKALANLPDPPSAPSQASRSKSIEAIAHALRAKRRRRARWFELAAVAAAALFVATGLAWRARAPAQAPQHRAAMATAGAVDGSVLVVNASGSRALASGEAVGAGDRVVARPDARAVLALATGTRLVVEGGGDLAIVGEGPEQLFRLSAGSVRADVAKLVAGERFVVRTPDADVEVRGTSFRVLETAPDPSCGGGTPTRVDVYEGVVAVRTEASETSVHPGERWPSGCDRAVPAPSALPSRNAHRAAPTAAAPTAAGRSDLAAQNDLFDRAVEARRRGDSAAALAGFEQYLARWPSSPLAEVAAAERMKLLATSDRERATAAARDYLVRYPDGFARSDAERILASLRR